MKVFAWWSCIHHIASLWSRLLEYIDQLSEQLGPNEGITIVVPQFNPRRWWTRLLHTRTAEMIRRSLLNRANIVILEVPYQVDNKVG